jgi:hypothetical protein
MIYGGFDAVGGCEEGGGTVVDGFGVEEFGDDIGNERNQTTVAVNKKIEVGMTEVYGRLDADVRNKLSNGQPIAG